jgi:Na+/H+ antiporter NhaC
MQLGSWALVNDTPSLLGLIPLVLYIALALIITDNMILPVAISLGAGLIMSGNGAVAFGTVLGAGLGSTMGQIGFLVVMGAGLGGVMNTVGVTTTLCKWIIRAFRVRDKKSAIFVIYLCQGILTLFIGSGVTAAAIAMPFLIPIAAVFAVRPITLATVVVFAGFCGMLLSPFSAPNITAMQLTGLTFPKYLLWSAAPYLIVMGIVSYFLLLRVEKKFENDNNAEKYELTEDEKNYDVEVTPQRRRSSIAFLVTFICSIIYIIIYGGGLAFTFFYMVLLTVVVALFGNFNIKDAINTFFESGAKMIQIFMICVLSQLLIDTVNVMGGFTALGEFFSTFVSGATNNGIFLSIATLIGAFGINGVASTQMIVIDQLFKPMLAAAGIASGMWAMVLIAGSYLTVVLYPSMTHFGALGLTRSKDMKTLLGICWISSGCQLIFCFAYYFILSIFF